MTSIDLTTALARLLSEPELRACFRENRLRVAQELLVSSDELEAFLNLDPDEVDRQAEGLIRKRFYEVSRLVPETVRNLGSPARQHFDKYATQNWPTGHQRHLKDAVEFCRFLKEQHNAMVLRSELNWLLFALSRRISSVHVVQDLVVHGKRRRAIQVFLKRHGTVHGFALHFGFHDLWHRRRVVM